MPIGIHGALTALLLLLASKVRPFALNKPGINGLLNVYKPYGLSSADVTNKIKSIIAENSPTKKKLVHIMRRRHIQVGHGGTLDKYTEGVLAVGIGTATKALTKFLKADKEYVCTSTFGFETDTNDIMVGDSRNPQGKIVHSAGWNHISDRMFDRALASMTGIQMQEVAGKPMYKLALRGRAVERRLSFVNVMEIVRLDGEELPNFKLFVRCSSGTYVRVLVRDLGRRLNSRATMTSLVGRAQPQVRTKKLNFELKDAVRLDSLTYDGILGRLIYVK